MDKIKETDIEYFNIDTIHIWFLGSNFDILRTKSINDITDDVFWKIYVEENKQSKNINFIKEYFFKVKYKNQKYIILTLKFWKEYNRLELYWKLFRLSKLNTWFTINEILDFVNTNFFNIELKKVDIALDVSTQNTSFLENLYDYLINEKKIKKWNVWNYQNWTTFESVNIWNINEKDNSYYYYRIYNKKLEIEKHNKDLKYLYLDYINKKEDIIRFEISMRKDVVKNISFNDLYFKNWKNKNLFNVLITYFTKKGVDIFGIEYKKALIKTIDNNVKWSIETKIDKTKNLKKLKSIKTSIEKIEDELWEDRITLLKNLDPIIKNSEDFKEYLFLYQQIFENIFLLYEDWNKDEIKYEDLVKIIEWGLKYASDFLGVSIDVFLSKIRWSFNLNLEETFKLFNEKIIKIIYLYYLTKQFNNDNLFNFLKIVDEDKLKNFNKYFDKEYTKKYLSKLKKQIDYSFNDKDINIINLFSIILK